MPRGTGENLVVAQEAAGGPGASCGGEPLLHEDVAGVFASLLGMVFSAVN